MLSEKIDDCQRNASTLNGFAPTFNENPKPVRNQLETFPDLVQSKNLLDTGL
ncbi:22552_t:CDS:2 [Dentiscutata erythropus]|uniref:22552_t:CDS:1 n=1 Tax=Dentiscutata erythropus TaxID=1348616 RepID=A0A9N9HR10_9GLOM|nr:22552_t:CDS:2 [Dentiscutata erythropus]